MTTETNDAIQDEDVSVAGQGVDNANATATDDNANAPRLTPHAAALESIANKLYADEDQAEAGNEGGRGTQPPQGAQQTESSAQEQMVKIKIDGEEQELPWSEVVKGYQKDQAASKRLEQAAQEQQRLAEERRQLEEERARLRAEAEALRNPKPNQAETQQQDTSQPSDDARRIYESLMLGDEESGVKALTELLSKGRGTDAPTIPVEQVASEAAEIAQARIDYNLAMRNFQQKYPDLAKDPDLNRMAVNLVNQTAPTSATYDEAFEKAATATREWVRKKVESLGLAVQSPANERLERKQQLDNLPTASARQPTKPAPKEESASEIVASMRTARGLPA
jgi:hypothetical protein